MISPPRSRRSTGEFPERPTEVHAVCEARRFRDVVERGRAVEQERLSASNPRVELPAIGGHAGGRFERPTEVRLGQIDLRCQLVKLDVVRQVGVDVVDHATQLPSRQAPCSSAVGATRREQQRGDRSC